MECHAEKKHQNERQTVNILHATHRTHISHTVIYAFSEWLNTKCVRVCVCVVSGNHRSLSGFHVRVRVELSEQRARDGENGRINDGKNMCTCMGASIGTDILGIDFYHVPHMRVRMRMLNVCAKRSKRKERKEDDYEKEAEKKVSI